MYKWGGLFVLALLVPGVVSAASVYLDPALVTLNAGDSATIAVRLNVDSETEPCVNAVDGIITYTSGLEVVDTSVGQSIFPMWVERPRIDTANNMVTFAGGIPNGYCGRIQGDPRLTNVIAEIIVRAPANSTASTAARLGFDPGTTAYQNDGYGTAVAPDTYGTTITMTGVPGDELIDPWRAAVEADTVPPANFSIALNQYPNGKYYISFNSTDKQTGIDHFEVMEQPQDQFGSFTWGRADAPWITAPYPTNYQLRDQSLNSVIYVKAIDKAGNETIATYIPEESLRTMSTAQRLGYFIYGGIALLLLVVAIIVYLFVIRPRRRKPAPVAMSETPDYSAAPEREETSNTIESHDEES